jgi:hypothetical protein
MNSIEILYLIKETNISFFEKLTEKERYQLYNLMVNCEKHTIQKVQEKITKQKQNKRRK